MNGIYAHSSLQQSRGFNEYVRTGKQPRIAFCKGLKNSSRPPMHKVIPDEEREKS